MQHKQCTIRLDCGSCPSFRNRKHETHNSITMTATAALTYHSAIHTTITFTYAPTQDATAPLKLGSCPVMLRGHSGPVKDLSTVYLACMFACLLYVLSVLISTLFCSSMDISLCQARIANIIFNFVFIHLPGFGSFPCKLNIHAM